MKKINRHKFVITLTVIYSVVLIISMAVELFYGKWGDFMLAIAIELGILVPFAANHFTRKKGMVIPSEAIIIYQLLVIYTFYFGDLIDCYNRFFWWDDIPHLFSGIILTIAGFYIIDIINVKQKATLITDSFYIALFSFCLANTLGVLWEIAEFTTDQLALTVNSQSGLFDTMLDLSYHAVASLLTSVIYYIYRRKKIKGMKIKSTKV